MTTQYTEHQIRLIAARLLEIKLNYHHEFYPVKVGNGREEYQCKKCPATYIVDYSKCPPAANPGICPIPDLSTEPLEVLAWKCRDKAMQENAEGWVKALRQIMADEMNYSCGEWGSICTSTPTHWILASAKAKGVEI